MSTEDIIDFSRHQVLNVAALILPLCPKEIFVLKMHLKLYLMDTYRVCIGI